MKKFMYSSMMAALLLLIHLPAIFAQNNDLTKLKWTQQLDDEEAEIKKYISEQIINSSTNDSIKHSFISDTKEHELTAPDLEKYLNTRLEHYYRMQYLMAHPEVVKLFNPGRAKPEIYAVNKTGNDVPCAQGDFESGNLSGYMGYGSTYTGGLCSFVPSSNVAYTNVGFSNPDNFLLTNNTSDPSIPVLKQTHNNSQHAIRINAPVGGSSIHMLQKSFLATSNNTMKIKFSYALVMQDGHGGKTSTISPFFVVRVLNSAGTEVGTRLCKVADKTDPFFQVYNTSLTWRNWTTDVIQFPTQAGKTYTIEFFVTNCSANLHYSYAYVDDICCEGDCCVAPPPENLQCTGIPNASSLSWDPVPGAQYYIVSASQYDPTCCSGPHPPDPTPSQWNVNSTNLEVPISWASCFSWTVTAVMPDGCRSTSIKKCSCTPPPPTGLGCDTVPNGSKLSWNPFPGALYYKVYLNQSDPFCCATNNIPTPISEIWNVSSTNVIVPTSFASCFSWQVVAVMPDSSRSSFSDKLCSCPPPPTGLNCDTVPNGSKLSWNPFPGALYYKVYLNQSDPFCCATNNIPTPISEIWNVSSTNVIVPTSFASCFSWQVVAVMPDSSRSAFSEKWCSCGIVRPESQKCTYQASGTPTFPSGPGYALSWSPVASAISYQIEINQNDPLCCSGGQPVNTVSFAISNSSVFIPYTVFPCFSWRVAANYANNIQSAWSDYGCSCKEGPKPGNDRSGMKQIFVTAIPNPASRLVEFKISGIDYINSHNRLQLYLYDMNGKEVTNKNFDGRDNIQLDVQQYMDGIYMYEVRDHQSVLFRDKIVIKK